MLKLYMADASPLAEDAVFKAYYAALSPERRAKVDRLRRESDKRLSVAAGALLNAALSPLGLRECEQTYTYGENGKPFFAKNPDLQFSISHAGTWVTVALSDVAVGCDIEQVVDGKTEAMARFFTANERRTLAAKEDYFRLWTRKESYAKATDRGMAHAAAFEAIADKIGEYRLTDVPAPEGYVAAVCTRSPEAVTVEIVKL